MPLSEFVLAASIGGLLGQAVVYLFRTIRNWRDSQRVTELGTVTGRVCLSSTGLFFQPDTQYKGDQREWQALSEQMRETDDVFVAAITVGIEK